MDNPDISYDQVRLFTRKKEDEKFQQVVYVNYSLEEYIHSLDLTNSVNDKVFTIQPFVISYKK